MMGNIRNHDDDVLGDNFFGVGEFELLSGRDFCVLDVHLFHEVLEDGDEAIFKIVGLGEDP